ncbi:glycosyltransferase family 2 protein [Nostoc sp.]
MQLTRKKMEKKIVFAGTVRNCEKGLHKAFKTLEKISVLFDESQFIFIESDSNDKTLDILEHYQRKIPNVMIVSLGSLLPNLPLRTHRIAYCRNKFLEIIESCHKLRAFDYLGVFDMDGINNLLSPESVFSCFEYDNWDVMTANQLIKYYDIWALRHPQWCPGDCWSEINTCKDIFGHITSEKLFIKKRQIFISKKTPPIEVESAFGGFALYKMNSILGCRYSGVNDNHEVCEHIEFHRQIRANGGRIYINPKLINSYGNTPYDSWTDLIRLKTLTYLIKSEFINFLKKAGGKKQGLKI